MLVIRSRFLTAVIVAMSLAALLTVVMSTKTPADEPSGSEDLSLHATKSSPRNRSHTLRSKDRVISTGKSGASKTGGSDAGPWNNTQIIREVSQTESQRLISRKASEVDNDKEKEEDNLESSFWTEDVQVGCKELRARRYISDGFCTSEEPIREVACAGTCLPIMDMPWYAEFVKTVAKNKLKDWQCVEDVVRKKRVKLLCQNGSSRHYRIKVVESCKCKKITNNHNRTTQKKKKKRRKDEKKNSNNGS